MLSILVVMCLRAGVLVYYVGKASDYVAQNGIKSVVETLWEGNKR